MSVTVLVLLIIAAMMLIAASSLIAAAETAFTRTNRSRADALAAAEAEDHAEDDEGDDRVEELRSFSRRPLTMLASLTFVQVLCQVGAVAVAFIIGREIAGQAGAVIAVAICLVVLFVAIAISRGRALLAPDTTAVGVVPILRVVAPLSMFTGFLVGFVRRSAKPAEPDPDVDEQQVLAIVGQTPAIDHEEEELIKRVVAFDDKVVGDIMTPRPDLVTLRSGFAVGDALQVATLHGLSRIPVTVTEADIDHIIGAVHVKDLIREQLNGRTKHDIDVWMRDVPVVPETQRIANLLVDLQTSEMHLAVVVDEHGGVAGVVTLEDILEEIVGEINDEFDQPEPTVDIVDQHTIRTDGRVEIGRVEDALGVALPAGSHRTIAGCVFNGLGRVPEVGDVLRIEEPGLELEVVRMHGRRIADLHVRSAAPLAIEIDIEAALAEETTS